MAYWGIALSNWTTPFASGPRPRRYSGGEWKRSPRRARRIREQRVSVPTWRLLRIYLAIQRIPTSSLVCSHTKAQWRRSAPPTLRIPRPPSFTRWPLPLAADPADKTYARQLKAGEILKALYAKYPDHPGLAHTSFTPTTFPCWLHVRPRLHNTIARLLLSTPHALHMPSHTFTRLGSGRHRSMPMSPLPPPHEMQGSRAMSCTPATTWSTPICRQPRTTPPGKSWNQPFRYSPALIQPC